MWRTMGSVSPFETLPTPYVPPLHPPIPAAFPRAPLGAWAERLLPPPGRWVAPGAALARWPRSTACQRHPSVRKGTQASFLSNCSVVPARSAGDAPRAGSRAGPRAGLGLVISEHPTPRPTPGRAPRNPSGAAADGLQTSPGGPPRSVAIRPRPDGLTNLGEGPGHGERPEALQAAPPERDSSPTAGRDDRFCDRRVPVGLACTKILVAGNRKVVRAPVWFGRGPR